MKTFIAVSVLAAANAVSANPTRTEKELPRRASSLPTVTASGNAFWAGSDRFYIRGIDYQPGGSSGGNDPLSDTTTCKRDIAKFKELGINTVRVYMVDNSANHDECMSELADAGIYLVLDVNNPKYSINRGDPDPSYNDVYLQSVFATIDAFANYDNTLAFFSGNEVINDEQGSTLAAPYVKATTRDMRQYISARSYRKIPVGYSAADVSSNRMQTAAYFNCGSDDDARSDFFAFNDYSWCQPSSFKLSGWDVKVKNFTGYGIPIFLSEYGCTTNGRNFEELSALMDAEMTGVYSGGLMYEYSMEDNGYGIVTIDGNDVTEEDEFGLYKSALSKYPAPTGSGGAASTTNSVACPTKDASWEVDDESLPVIPEPAKAYFTKGAGAGPGLSGDGSQNAGTKSSSNTTGSSGAAISSSTGKSVGIRSAPPMDLAIFGVAGVVGFFTLAGSLLL